VAPSVTAWDTEQFPELEADRSCYRLAATAGLDPRLPSAVLDLDGSERFDGRHLPPAPTPSCHPMYAYAVRLMIGAPLLLGLALRSPGRGIAPTAVGGSRARRGGHAPGRLPGYREYAAKVRFRPCPVYGDEPRLRRCRAERRTEAISTPFPLIFKIR
jgi:hypothetical protein